MHAGIEQDLKGILIEEWNMPEDIVEKKYGHKLRKFFLESIKQQNINEKYYITYLALIDRFWKASEKRNEFVKTTYGLMEQTGEVFRYDLKARGKFDPQMDFNQWKKKAVKTVTLEELQSLIDEFAQIREAIFQLSAMIFVERENEAVYDQ